LISAPPARHTPKLSRSVEQKVRILQYHSERDSEHPSIYLAGPDVFLPGAAEIGARKRALCTRYGFAGLFPFDNEVPPGPGQDRAIYAANLAMMQAAAGGIFNLTPFRGPSADPGTVFELGLMAGLGKPVFGYTNDARDILARVPGAMRGADGLWRDPAGLTVEDFHNADNLMIDACLAAAGPGIVRIDAGGRLDGLDGFEVCLRLAVQVRDSGGFSLRA
jgi:nucleoside 2-deoxyribosyltransferase